MAKKKSKKRSSKRARTTKKAGAPRAKLDAVSTDALTSELRRRQRDLDKLVQKRDRMAEQLAALDREIAAVGGAGGFGVTARGSIRRRPRNETNLADALVAELTGKTMGVSEVADAVLASGYRTSAANFRTIVNQTLLRDKRIKKISRGQYTAK